MQESQKNKIIVKAGLVVKEGKTDEFFSLFKPVIAETRKEAGCLCYELFSDTQTPRAFYFYEEYKDSASYDAHRSAPYMLSMRPKRDLLVEKYLGVNVFNAAEITHPSKRNTVIETVFEKIKSGGDASYEEILTLVKESPREELFDLADRLRTLFLGKKFETCSIMNARSGRCSENCKWCSQSAHHKTSINIYPLVSKEEALDFGKTFDKNNVTRFSLVTSGRTIAEADTQKVVDTYKHLRANMHIELCGSLGLLNAGQLKALWDAGMTRYHCNLETAPSYFPKLCSTHTIAEKLETISAARELGMEICCGGIIGMGESLEQRVEFAVALQELKADSIPVNILNPIEGTPLYGTPPLSDDEILTSFAIFRIANPRAHIRFAGGRMQISHIQKKALKCGVSAALVGDMLTTVGSDMKQDFAMLKEMGYEY